MLITGLLVSVWGRRWGGFSGVRGEAGRWPVVGLGVVSASDPRLGLGSEPICSPGFGLDLVGVAGPGLGLGLVSGSDLRLRLGRVGCTGPGIWATRS